MGVAVKLASITLCEKMGWNERALRARHRQGERSFDRGFRQKAFVEGEATFGAFERCCVPGITLGTYQRSDWPKFTGVDLSSAKRPGNAIVTVAVDPLTRRRYVIDVRFGAWRSNETCEQIGIVNRLYSPTIIMVEDNGYQEALIDWALSQKKDNHWWMKVEGCTTTGQSKKSQEIGLPVLQVEFERKGWVFPLSEWEGATPEDDPPRGHWARLHQEFKHHPIAANTDGVMATWFARQGIEMHGGLAFEADEELGDINVR